MNKVLIFGATGGTGLELVKQCLELGYEVSVFVHNNAEALGDLINKVTVYTGDAKDFEIVNSAIVGKDAVMVALGAILGKKDAILARSTANIVRSMQENNVKRLVVETGAALVEDKKLLPAVWRVMPSLPPMKSMFDDKAIQEKIVKNSGLDWVIVRPANLTNGVLTKNYRADEALKLHVSSKISRADVAHFMVEQLIYNEWLYKPVMVSI